jgi:hypothetical protein
MKPLLKHLLHYLLASATLTVSASVMAQSPDELAKAARDAARANHNRQSADLFEQALVAAPERRREWLREYADQLTYSERAPQAVVLYREYLAGQTEPDDQQRGLQGLALALSWADQPSESRLVYEALLAQDPGNIDAQRSLGRVMSWSGRQRDAQAYLRNFLLNHPNDPEGRFLLAQAQWWLGRPDSARETLADTSSTALQREDAISLERTLNRATGPATRFDRQRSTQSDDLDIASTLIQHQWISANGLTLVAPRWQRITYSPRGGEPGITVERPGAWVRHRFSDNVEINVEATRDLIRPQGLPDDTEFIYSSWLTWFPNDLFRIDLTSNRETFDNVRSLQRGIVARGEGVSLDWLPNERARLTTRFSRSDYSDGNRRDFTQIELERRLGTRPLLWAGLRYTHFDFARQLDNGYFNPRTFDAYLLTLRAHGGSKAPGARFSWSAQLAGGTEHAIPDGDKPTYEVGVTAAYRLGRNTSLETRLQRFSSRIASTSGFARTTAGITLVYEWGAD